jgi:hypothetical protein
VKIYKAKITLNKNSRGCYILDTIKGCPGGSLYEEKGCYGSCYAKNIAMRYGFDFEKEIARKFENENNQLWMFGLADKTHTNKIIREIELVNMPFIRIGEMGDPSVNWRHTISVCREISVAKKKIVIITKHWETIPDNCLKEIERLGLCINTSVSALDNDEELDHRLKQFERLKNCCNSVLRIVSCDFNKEHSDGLDKCFIQNELFKMGNCIDTVFRPSVNNIFVSKNIIKVEKIKFLKATVLASIFNKKTYLGRCDNCPEMCGLKFQKIIA